MEECTHSRWTRRHPEVPHFDDFWDGKGRGTSVEGIGTVETLTVTLSEKVTYKYVNVSFLTRTGVHLCD